MSRRSAATPKTITREESSRGSPHTSTPSTMSTTSVRSAKIAAVFFLDHDPPPAVSVACELYHDAEHPYVSQAPFLLLLSPIHAVDIAWLFHKHIRHGQSSSCSCTRVLAQHARAAAYFPCSTHADPSACTLTCTSASRPLQIVFIAVTLNLNRGPCMFPVSEIQLTLLTVILYSQIRILTANRSSAHWLAPSEPANQPKFESQFRTLFLFSFLLFCYFAICLNS